MYGGQVGQDPEAYASGPIRRSRPSTRTEDCIEYPACKYKASRYAWKERSSEITCMSATVSHAVHVN